MIRFAILGAIALIFGGCGATRSISYHTGNQNQLYGGELSQFDVLTQLCPAGADAQGGAVTISKGSRVVVMQSGQMSPEAAVTRALNEHVIVIPFSGSPSPSGHGGSTWREIAKRGSIATVIVYWGQIETEYRALGTTYVSWTPVVGWFIPDGEQTMRIRMKYLLVDIDTGAWEFHEVVSDESREQSAMYNRGAKDLSQITDLKSGVMALMTREICQKIR